MMDLMDAFKRAEDDLEGQLKRVKEARRTLEGRDKPGRKPASAKPDAQRKKSKRRGVTRADQALTMIEQTPGITGGEIAKAMKIKPNYLYRVLGELEKEGRVKKRGRQYDPVAS